MLIIMPDDDFTHCLHAAGPEEPDAPPPMRDDDTPPPFRPRVTGGVHSLAMAIGVLMLIFDGFMALGILNTAAMLLQFNADPQAVLNKDAFKAMLPANYPLPPLLLWFRQYFQPMMGLFLIGQVGSLLLVFGVIGFLRRKRWCVHPLFLGFGIHVVYLIVLSVALGPMTGSLAEVLGEKMTPAEHGIGLAMTLAFIWLLFLLFRGVPALVLRASIRARWEEEFN